MHPLIRDELIICLFLLSHSFRFEVLVKLLPPARLCNLSFEVFPLETTSFRFARHDLFYNGPFALFILQARAEVFRRSLNDSSHLRVLWAIWIEILLSVVTLWIKN